MASGKRPSPKLVVYGPTREAPDRVLYFNPASASMVVTDQAGHRVIQAYLGGAPAPDAFLEKLAGTLIFAEPQAAPGYGSIPQRLIVELTTACNLRCKTCYMSASMSRRDELSTGEVTALLGDAAACGTETVAFIGGEPLVREDLPLLVEFALARFADVMISTNGTLAGRDLVERFAGARNLVIQVSLDGPDSGSHDAIRGRGSFEKASRLLDLAGEHGIRTAVSSVLNRHNYNSVGAICDFAAGKGCVMTIFHKVHVSGRAKDFPEILPTGAQLARGMGLLLGKFDEYERHGRMIVDFPHNRCFRGDSTLDPAFPGCHFGRASAYIASDGSLATCSHLRDGEFLCGNVRSEPLLEIWQKSSRLDKMRRMTVDDLPACRSCPSKYLCRGSCRADALGASGSLEGSPPDCDALRGYYDYVLAYYARTMAPVIP
jgi:[mycofactocin precursor peptide]-tyrosine decarboxylase / 3-amino-5-[(4-hydroxyphenyl)methyl]-4,4-dimethylpyrrolidin-2-one synthase